MGAFRYVAFVVAVAVAVVVSEPNDLTRQQPTVLKCCRYGEELHLADDGPKDALPNCQPSSSEWKPLIYSPSQRSLKERTPPDEWHVLEGKRPECDERSELKHVPYRKPNPYILVDDGNAMLEIGSTDSFPADRYCADANALLVCVQRKSAGNHAAATMRPRVRRCCGENATFHERR